MVSLQRLGTTALPATLPSPNLSAYQLSPWLWVSTGRDSQASNSLTSLLCVLGGAGPSGKGGSEVPSSNTGKEPTTQRARTRMRSPAQASPAQRTSFGRRSRSPRTSRSSCGRLRRTNTTGQSGGKWRVYEDLACRTQDTLLIGAVRFLDKLGRAHIRHRYGWHHWSHHPCRHAFGIAVKCAILVSKD